MTINWVELAAIATPFLLAGGVAVSIIEGLFRRPEKAANVTTLYTKVGLDLLHQSQQTNKRLELFNARLEKANTKLNGELTSILGELRRTRRAMEQCSVDLAKTRLELLESKHTIRLLVEAVDHVIPLLEKAASGDAVRELAEIVLQARRSINGQTD